MPNEEFMRLTLEMAREGAGRGQWPFGACLVRGDEVVSCRYNETRANRDPTAHAEIQVLREGCTKLKSLDLTGCELYATCEPCPMCFYACHAARVATIIYAASLEDFPDSGRRRRITTASQMKESLESPVQLIGGFLRDPSIELFSS